MSVVPLGRGIVKDVEGVHSPKGRLVGVHSHRLLEATHLLLLAHHWLEAGSWLATVEGIAVILRTFSTHHLTEGVRARQVLCLVLLRWLQLGSLA